MRLATISAKHGRFQRFDQDTSGQTLVILAIIFAVLLAFMGLVFDGGRLYFEKRRMQAAADGGAMGAAWELYRRNPGKVVSAARNDATLNGFEHGVAAVDVQVNHPPLTGPRAGNSSFVEVVIEQPMPITFLRVLNWDLTTVRARAVAGLVPYFDVCILALDRQAPDTFVVRGSARLEADCGLMSNSAHPGQGFRASGEMNIQAEWVGVSGGFLQEGSATVNPNPEQGVPPILDPLAYLSPPDWTGWPSAVYNSSTNTYECPGGQCVFDSTLQISGPATKVNHFQPGTYVLRNGMNIEGTQVFGSGVTFYNAAEGGYGIRVAGQASVQLSAPTSGPYKGILLYGNPDVCELPAQENDIGRGSSTFQYRGALYFPCQHLDWAGNSFGTNPWGMVVGRTLDYAGEEDFFLQAPPADEAPAITRPSLME